MKRTMGVVVCLAMILPASLAYGQQESAQPNQQQQDQQQAQQGQRDQQRTQQRTQQGSQRQRRGNQAARGERTVSQVATVLALGNQAEIQLAQLAMEEANNDNVREFARLMVESHTNYLEKLQPFNPQLQGTSGPGQQSQLLPVLRQASLTRLAMTKDTLSRYEGQDFDMGYLSQQVYAHVNMLAHLQAARRVGTPEFQQVVDQGIQTTKEHLELAKQLAKRLEDRERQDRSDPAGANR